MLGIAFVGLAYILAYYMEEDREATPAPALPAPIEHTTREETPQQRVFEWEFTPSLQVEHKAEPQQSRA